MTRPLPPVVHGPITPSSPAVRVTAVVAGATVDLLVGGGSVGSDSSSAGGTLFVTVNSALSAGQTVTAQQTTADGTSDASSQGVPVIDVPDPLPVPVFASPLSTCVSTLRLDGLVPGATVEVRHNGTTVGRITAGRTSEFVRLDPAVSLSAGSRLEARQEVRSEGGVLSSAPAFSLPLPLANREQQLPAPGIGQPVIACKTALAFSNMVPSAEVVVDNEGTATEWLNVAAAYTGWGAAPFQQGKLIAKQRFTNCGLESPDTVVPVGPPQPPGQPVITALPCPKLRKVYLTGLEPGATVVLSTVVPDPSTPGAVVVTPIGETVASTASEDFDLPAGLQTVTSAGAQVLLTARQTLCGLPSIDANRVAFALPTGPVAAPTLVTPNFECARQIRVTGALPASLLQPFYSDAGLPAGDAVPATSADATLNLWFELGADRIIMVRQVDCNGSHDSEDDRVKPLPDPLPVPTIVEPVRPQAASVTARGCIPGAFVHLLVNNVVRKSIGTLLPETVIPTGDVGLNANDVLWAVQTLCDKESSLEGRGVIVRKGNMALEVQPSTVTRGTTAKVRVNARDADTGAPINGAQVFLNGALVGQTAVEFPFSPALNLGSAAGVVKEPVAHNDASFAINLVNPPPKPQGKLYLNVGPSVLIPNQLRLVTASWTVKTVWTPVQTFTASSANTSVTLPDPPPAPADRRVSVELDTTWEVAGVINGIYFPYQQFKGHMSPNPTLLAWEGKDLTSGWMVQWGIEYDNAGYPWVIVATVYQASQ
jgi:hypothetical protein